jgi:hypothetical protein
MRKIPYLILLAAAMQASAQVPVVDCVGRNPDGNLVAYFGYVNNPVRGINIPLGTDNNVSSGQIVGSIPSFFPNAAEHILFGVVIGQAGTTTWTLNARTATASASQIPSTPCQILVGQALPAGMLSVCWNTFSDGTTNRCDAVEDVDGDGFCTILDCIGGPGQRGSTGAAGSPGPAGSAGPTGTPPVLQTVTVSPGQANATAACAANQILVSGGGSCEVPNLAGAGRVASSAVSSAVTGWTVSCNAGQATAVAVCAVTQ